MSDHSETLTVARPAAQASGWASWPVALFSTLAFSMASPLMKSAIDLAISPTVLLVARLSIATALFGLTSLVTSPNRHRLERRGVGIALLAGGIHSVGMLSFYWSLTRLDTSIASMIFSLYPLAVLGLLALRGEKFTYRNLVRLAAGLLGVYLLIGPGGRIDLLGVLLVLVSILGSSIQTVLNQWYLRDHDSQTALFYVFVGMTAVALLALPVVGGAGNGMTPRAWLAMGTVAMVSTYAAWMAWFFAMRHLGTGQVALLVPLETFLTVIWSVSFLGDRLTPIQWLGGGFILLSTLLAMRRMQRVRFPFRRQPPIDV
jgi:DME family drug/metabolite transporter